MQTALLKSACHVASVQRDLVAKVEEFGLTQPPPRTQTLLGIFDVSLGARFMSKAHKCKDTREGSTWKAEHRVPFVVLPMTSWASTTADIPKKRLSTRLTTSTDVTFPVFCARLQASFSANWPAKQTARNLSGCSRYNFPALASQHFFALMIFCKISARKKMD